MSPDGQVTPALGNTCACRIRFRMRGRKSSHHALSLSLRGSIRTSRTHPAERSSLRRSWSVITFPTSRRSTSKITKLLFTHVVSTFPRSRCVIGQATTSELENLPTPRFSTTNLIASAPDQSRDTISLSQHASRYRPAPLNG